MSKWFDNYWRILATISIIIVICLILPVTRPTTLFILPLGRGYDDVAVLILIVIALLFSIFGLEREKFNEKL